MYKYNISKVHSQYNMDATWNWKPEKSIFPPNPTNDPCRCSPLLQ